MQLFTAKINRYLQKFALLVRRKTKHFIFLGICLVIMVPLVRSRRDATMVGVNDVLFKVKTDGWADSTVHVSSDQAYPSHELSPISGLYTSFECDSEDLVSRSCEFTNLFFKNGMFYVRVDPSSRAPNLDTVKGVFLHNRPYEWARFSPFLQPAPTNMFADSSSALRKNGLYFVTTFWSTHPAHNQLDAAYSRFAVLARRGYQHHNSTSVFFPIPVPGEPDINDHIHTPAVQFHAVFDGNQPFTQASLTAACAANGCVLNRVLVGQLQLGLCAMDSHNCPYGFRDEATHLWKFRDRVFSRHHVEPRSHTPCFRSSSSSSSLQPARGRTATTGGKVCSPTVLFVTNKRILSNRPEMLSKAIEAGAHSTRSRIVDWASMSIEEQLRACSEADVYVSSNGSAMMNAYMLARGAVVVHRGEPTHVGVQHISYFDSHVNVGLDYVRTLFYPNYTVGEYTHTTHGWMSWAKLGTHRYDPTHVWLSWAKLGPLLDTAFSLVREGYPLPVPQAANQNRFDRAYQELCQLSDIEHLRFAGKHDINDCYSPGLNVIFFRKDTCVDSALKIRLIAKYEL